MNRVFASWLSAAVLATFAAACDKTEPVPTPALAPSSVPSAVAPITPKVVEPVASAVLAPSATPATSGSAAAVDCGGKDNPCPLQAWMRENVNPPMNKSDGPGLAAALDKIAGMAPAGYTNWASISKDGANAARSGDLNAAKASCRGCHDQYKQKYKTEMRGRKVPGV